MLKVNVPRIGLQAAELTIAVPAILLRVHAAQNIAPCAVEELVQSPSRRARVLRSRFVATLIGTNRCKDRRSRCGGRRRLFRSFCRGETQRLTVCVGRGLLGSCCRQRCLNNRRRRGGRRRRRIRIVRGSAATSRFPLLERQRLTLLVRQCLFVFRRRIAIRDSLHRRRHWAKLVFNDRRRSRKQRHARCRNLGCGRSRSFRRRRSLASELRRPARWKRSLRHLSAFRGPCRRNGAGYIRTIKFVFLLGFPPTTEILFVGAEKVGGNLRTAPVDRIVFVDQPTSRLPFVRATVSTLATVAENFLC